MVRTAGVRQDNRKTKKISWSIKESEFAALMSFPSSFRRDRSSAQALEKGYRYGDGRDVIIDTKGAELSSANVRISKHMGW